MAQYDLFSPPKHPWNTARIIGPKPPFKPKHIWGIRQQLKTNGRVRDLAMFNSAIDSKSRGVGGDASGDLNHGMRRKPCRPPDLGAVRVSVLSFDVIKPHELKTKI